MKPSFSVFLPHLSRRSNRPIPEVKPRLPARWRGRIVLSRDPSGDERYVACYLCAAACPVDCIALTGRRKGCVGAATIPHSSASIFHRCIFCGFREEACPTYTMQSDARFRDGRMATKRTWFYEKEDPFDRRVGQVPRIRFYKCCGVSIRRQDGGRAQEENTPVRHKGSLCHD